MKAVKELLMCDGSDGCVTGHSDDSVDSPSSQNQIVIPPGIIPVVEPPAPSNSAELSQIYKYYVIYECILVNIVGFFTLFFQCKLQILEKVFRTTHVEMPKQEADAIFGHFWLKDNLNCSTPQAHCLTYMIAGWLMIAAILQVFINFDNLRRRVFGAADWDCPRGLKKVCLYSYFLCDWYWVVLMWNFQGVVTNNQIIGSALDIALRLYFVFNTDHCFKYNPTTKK